MRERSRERAREVERERESVCVFVLVFVCVCVPVWLVHFLLLHILTHKSCSRLFGEEKGREEMHLWLKKSTRNKSTRTQAKMTKREGHPLDAKALKSASKPKGGRSVQNDMDKQLP